MISLSFAVAILIFLGALWEFNVIEEIAAEPLDVDDSGMQWCTRGNFPTPLPTISMPLHQPSLETIHHPGIFDPENAPCLIPAAVPNDLPRPGAITIPT